MNVEWIEVGARLDCIVLCCVACAEFVCVDIFLFLSSLRERVFSSDFVYTNGIRPIFILEYSFRAPCL